MSQEQWWKCDGCDKRVQCDYVNQAESALKGWVRIDLKISSIQGDLRRFEAIEFRPTCCSTACVGAFFEKYAKDFEGQLEFADPEPKKKASK